MLFWITKVYCSKEVSISKKNKLDQYYTKTEIAIYFSKLIKDRYEDDSFIEPSAGTGSFSKCFEDIISFDLDPKFEGCIKQDFLAVEDIPEGCVFVGNPPFGFCSRLAIAFINKCCELKAKAICFILPKTFKKVLFQNNINRNYKLVYQEDLPRNSFILGNTEYDVPCVFQIWEHSAEQRDSLDIDISVYFDEVNKTNATHAIRRVGGQAGKILKGLDHSESTTYFVRMAEDIAEKVTELYPLIKEEASHTAGVRSITLKEIAHILNNSNKIKKKFHNT